MRCRLFILSLSMLFMSCHDREKATPKEAAVPTIIQPALIMATIIEQKPFKKFRSFWDYYGRDIKLNEDFVAYDKDHKQIHKAKFLKILSSGSYQPILINPTDSIRYQLKRSPTGAETSIGDYMKMFAKEQLVFYGMEGKPVPRFNFETIKGDRYTSENTKGKIVLFKCWFITCVTCVEEMPQLNTLVQKYRDRKDIVFLSLATDDKGPLKTFLQKTKFDYQTVAKQATYMSDKLKVTAYPTHFLIDKSGRLVKVSNSADEVETFLERMLTKEAVN